MIDDRCKKLVQEDSRLSSCEVAKEIKCSHMEILNILKDLYLKYKHNLFVPPQYLKIRKISDKDFHIPLYYNCPRQNEKTFYFQEGRKI